MCLTFRYSKGSAGLVESGFNALSLLDPESPYGGRRRQTAGEGLIVRKMKRILTGRVSSKLPYGLDAPPHYPGRDPEPF